MTLRDFYRSWGGNYALALSRAGNETLLRGMLLRFTRDEAMTALRLCAAQLDARGCAIYAGLIAAKATQLELLPLVQAATALMVPADRLSMDAVVFLETQWQLMAAGIERVCVAE